MPATIGTMPVSIFVSMGRRKGKNNRRMTRLGAAEIDVHLGQNNTLEISNFNGDLASALRAAADHIEVADRG